MKMVNQVYGRAIVHRRPHRLRRLRQAFRPLWGKKTNRKVEELARHFARHE